MAATSASLTKSKRYPNLAGMSCTLLHTCACRKRPVSLHAHSETRIAAPTRESSLIGDTAQDALGATWRCTPIRMRWQSQPRSRLAAGHVGVLLAELLDPLAGLAGEALGG